MDTNEQNAANKKISYNSLQISMKLKLMIDLEQFYTSLFGSVTIR